MRNQTSRSEASVREPLVRRLCVAVAAALVTLGASACAGAPVSEPGSEAAAGARIWRATCDRCHNVRPASEFSSREWPVLVAHMRARAHLTREEAEAVTAFLVELAPEP